MIRRSSRASLTRAPVALFTLAGFFLFLAATFGVELAAPGVAREAARFGLARCSFGFAFCLGAAFASAAVPFFA